MISIKKSFKVENILKGSLDSIPSPSPENSNYGRESLLKVLRQTVARHCQQSFENITQQCFA